jgi:hypothetical protein
MANQSSQESQELSLPLDKTLTQQGEQRSPFAPNLPKARLTAPSFAFGDIIG